MTDVTVALPEPGDIQVATGWPQVDAYRAALIHAERLAYKADVLARSLEATRRRVPATTAKRQEIRDRAYRKYKAAADEHEQAVNAARQGVPERGTRRAGLGPHPHPDARGGVRR